MKNWTQISQFRFTYICIQIWYIQIFKLQLTTKLKPLLTTTISKGLLASKMGAQPATTDQQLVPAHQGHLLQRSRETIRSFHPRQATCSSPSSSIALLSCRSDWKFSQKIHLKHRLCVREIINFLKNRNIFYVIYLIML